VTLLGTELEHMSSSFHNLKLWTHCMARVGGGIQGECREVPDSASL
jgi:hypothetical protein